MNNPIVNLTIEGFLMDEYIAKSGFSYKKIKRVDSTVTTMDGTKHSRWIDKIEISVSLFEMNETAKQQIESHLFVANKNTVSVSFQTEGSLIPHTGNYYVDGWNPKIKTIEAETRYYEGLSFTLEEK